MPTEWCPCGGRAHYTLLVQPEPEGGLDSDLPRPRDEAARAMAEDTITGYFACPREDARAHS